MNLRTMIRGLFAATQGGSSAFSPWVCRRCYLRNSQQQQQQKLRLLTAGQRAAYHATRPQARPNGAEVGAGGGKGGPGSGKRARKGLKYVAAGSALGVGAFAFSDDVQHAYTAATRTGRVVRGLVVCINE